MPSLPDAPFYKFHVRVPPDTNGLPSERQDTFDLSTLCSAQAAHPPLVYKRTKSLKLFNFDVMSQG